MIFLLYGQIIIWFSQPGIFEIRGFPLKLAQRFWVRSCDVAIIWLDDIIVGILTTSTPRKTKTIPWAEIIASLKHWGTMVVNNALFATLKLWFVGASFPVVGEWGWISTNDIGHLRNDTRWLRYTILGEQSLTLPEVNILLMEKSPASADRLFIPFFTILYTSQVVVWDFFHQP